MLVVDAAAEAAFGRPLRTRVQLSPAGVLRGELDGVRAVFGGVSVAGLLLHRVDVRARRVGVVPGLPSHLRIGEVDVGVSIRQADMDAWTQAASLPVRIRLRPDGIAARAGLAGVRLGEVVVDLAVDRGRLRLVPRHAGVLGLGLNNPSVRLLRFDLPLLPLPAGARLLRLVPGDGEVEVWFSAAGLDQELTPAAMSTLRGRVGRVVRPASAGA